MNGKIAVILAIAATAALLLSYTPSPSSTRPNLISQDKAEAYELFEKWAYDNARIYTKEGEKSYRFGKFFENYLFVKEHKLKYALGKETFDVELNNFADLDNYEFRALYTGLKRTEKKSATNACNGQVEILSDPPKSVDWADKAVASVKNQGQCGSCWAFSACGALEGLYALSNNKIQNFAPQQLVDCAGGQYQNEGCNGGDMPNAFWYVIDNGIALEEKYPYKGKDQKCAYKETMKFYQNKGCALVPANKTIALESAVARQPVSISVEADSLRFQFYSKGVFSGKCGIDLDHGIVLTGYGNLDGQDYWKCKNSWGATWGMQGYILLAKGEDGPGQCGVLMDNSVPLL